jgi:hypothetical protein
MWSKTQMSSTETNCFVMQYPKLPTYFGLVRSKYFTELFAFQHSKVHAYFRYSLLYFSWVYFYDCKVLRAYHVSVYINVLIY